MIRILDLKCIDRIRFVRDEIEESLGRMTKKRFCIVKFYFRMGNSHKAFHLALFFVSDLFSN